MDAIERFRELRGRYDFTCEEPVQETVTRIVAGYDPPVIPTPKSPYVQPVPAVAKIIEASQGDESVADRRERAKMPAVIEDFLAYRLQRDIADRHGLKRGVVSRMIRDNTTEAQKLDVRRWHTARIERDHKKRERERQGKQRGAGNHPALQAGGCRWRALPVNQRGGAGVRIASRDGSSPAFGRHPAGRAEA